MGRTTWLGDFLSPPLHLRLVECGPVKHHKMVCISIIRNPPIYNYHIISRTQQRLRYRHNCKLQSTHTKQKEKRNSGERNHDQRECDRSHATTRHDHEMTVMQVFLP